MTQNTFRNKKIQTFDFERDSCINFNQVDVCFLKTHFGLEIAVVVGVFGDQDRKNIKAN